MISLDVSIIIVNFNTMKLTEKCIDSIINQTKDVNYEIIVIDNNSSDNSVLFLSNKFPQIEIISSKKNIGFGRANNLAATIAKGKYLFLLNSDTILLNNAVKYFFLFFESNTMNLGALGAVLLNEKEQLNWSFGKFNSISTILKWYYLRFFNLIRGKNKIWYVRELSCNEAMKVDYITGADLFIPANIFDELNGFDENIFLYYEDEELQYRMLLKGYDRCIIGGPKIIHLEGASSSPSIKGKVSNSKRILSERSMFYYFNKKRGHYYKLMAKVIYFLMVSLPLRFQYSLKENKEYIKAFIRF